MAQRQGMEQDVYVVDTGTKSQTVGASVDDAGHPTKGILLSRMTAVGDWWAVRMTDYVLDIHSTDDMRQKLPSASQLVRQNIGSRFGNTIESSHNWQYIGAECCCHATGRAEM